MLSEIYIFISIIAFLLFILGLWTGVSDKYVKKGFTIMMFLMASVFFIVAGMQSFNIEKLCCSCNVINHTESFFYENETQQQEPLGFIDNSTVTLYSYGDCCNTCQFVDSTLAYIYWLFSFFSIVFVVIYAFKSFERLE